MRQLLPILTLLVIVIIVGVFTWWMLSEEPGPLVIAESPVTEPVAPAARRPAPAVVPGRNEREPRLPDESSATAETASPPAVSPAEPSPTDVEVGEGEMLVSGTVVVIDAEGAESTRESGSFHFVSWRGSRGRHVDVHVTAGAYQAVVPVDAILEAGGMRLGDRRATVSTPRRAARASDTYHLRARWAEPVTLHVLSAITDEHLDDVTIAEGRWDYPHPAVTPPKDSTPAKIVVRDAQSPIEVPEGEGIKELWVGAKGFAWAQVALDAAGGGTRTVTLSPAAMLELYVQPPPTRGNLALFRDGESGDEDPVPILDVPFTQTTLVTAPLDPVQITGLLPGSYRAAGQLGESYDEPHVLGQTKFQLTAGVTLQAILPLQLLPDLPAAVPVSGTLTLGAGWGAEEPRVLLDSVTLPGGAEEVSYHHARMASTGDPTYWLWTAGDLIPGKYQARVSPGGVTIPFDVPEGVPAVVPLEVGPPAELLVRVTDGETGQLVPMANVQWLLKPPEGMSGGALEPSRYDPDRGWFEILVPVGRDLHVNVEAEGYLRKWIPHTAAAGSTTVEVELARGTQLVLQFYEGSAPVPYAFKWNLNPHVRHVDSQDLLDANAWSTEGVRFDLASPGRYEITFDEDPQFTPVAPQIVDCAGPEPTHIRVQLERR